MGLKLVGELWGLKMGIGEVNYPGDWVPRNGVLSTQRQYRLWIYDLLIRIWIL
jgi:hypothetical protein